jgi:hypothetical protein
MGEYSLQPSDRLATDSHLGLITRVVVVNRLNGNNSADSSGRVLFAELAASDHHASATSYEVYSPNGSVHTGTKG